MIGLTVHYYSDALPDPGRPRPAILTAPGIRPGEWNAMVFMDRRDIHSGAGRPPLLGRMDLCMVPQGGERPPGVREYLHDVFGLVPAPPTSASPSAAKPTRKKRQKKNTPAPEPKVEDITEPAERPEAPPLKGPLAQVLENANGSRLEWSNNGQNAYVCRDRYTHVPAIMLTLRGQRWQAFSLSLEGHKGGKLGEWNSSSITAAVEQMDDLAQPIIEINQKELASARGGSGEE